MQDQPCISSQPWPICHLLLILSLSVQHLVRCFMLLHAVPLVGVVFSLLAPSSSVILTEKPYSR